MKILLNGVYVGGNCPPFYNKLKQGGHEVKILDATYFNNHYTNFAPVIKNEDILIPGYTRLEFLLYKLYEKTGARVFLSAILKKLKKCISVYNPDVIINHQMSLRANLMLYTGFKPQLGFIYGSEIKGENVSKKTFEYAVKETSSIVAATDNSKNIIISAYPFAEKKINVIVQSFFNHEEILQNLKNSSIAEVRKKYRFSEEDFILFDNRSLRDETILKDVLEGYILAIKASPAVKFFLIAGFSGKPKLIELAKKLIWESKCENNFHIIEKFLPDEEHYKLIMCSDAITSFLRADQFGEVILQGMFLKKYLLLFDLPQYRQILNNNALYTNGSSQSVAEQIKKMQAGSVDIDIENNRKIVLSDFSGEESFKKINELLKKTVHDIY